MENEILNLAFLLIGGLAIFLLGMHFTSDGLQKIAGAKMKKVMTGLTHNRVIGTFTGVATTALVQSSSFMSVMVVGLVSAHLLNLTQAATLIVGMNVGTTITAQIIALKLSALSLPMIAVGVYFHLFAKKERYHFIGQVFMGLGMLFLGLEYMKEAFAPLKDDPAFQEFFVRFGDNILLALLVGIITTLIIQSSSAIIGITMALATSGVLGLAGAIAIVLGSNIGTTLTAQLAAFKMNRTAKRAATFHSVFNIVGVVLVMFVFGYFVDLVEIATPHEAGFIAEDGTRPYAARHLANAHTIFNVINMVIFIIILPYLVKFVEWLIPRTKGARIKGMFRLQKAYLKAPDIALMQVKLACIEMMKAAKNNLDVCKKCPDAIGKYQAEFFKNEELINAYRIDISKYLGKIGAFDLTEKQAQSIPVFLHLVNDIESMADEVKHIVKTLIDLDGKGERLTTSEKRTFESLIGSSGKYCDELIKLLQKANRNRVMALEEELIEFRLKKLDKVKIRNAHMSEILSDLHDLTRKIANILVMTREI